jgi:ABC-type thiamin/hydroxymethylpyrimidine transport system permease subunit
LIENDLTRQILLCLTALTFLVLAIRTVFSPEKVAAELGYTLVGANGYSELYAIYVGLWIASAALAFFAAARVGDALLGDIVAVLVLAQPFGRCVALIRHGMPRGALLAFFALEVVGGVLLLAVRPST